MITLTYTRQQPVNGDFGNVFFPSLAANIAINDAHDHDGITSSLISPASITKFTQSIASGSWAAVAGETGTYSQTVTLPAGAIIDDIIPSFRDASGHVLNLTVEKVTTTSIKVYINDNTLTLTAIYR